MTKREGKKFIARVIELIALELGADSADPMGRMKLVSDAVGIPRPTLYHWLNRSRPSVIPVAKAVRMAELAKIDVKEFVR